jgi:hypothetical protein
MDTALMFASQILPRPIAEDPMDGSAIRVPTEPSALPSIAARASEARRRHHLQILRRGLITALIVAIVGFVSWIAVPVIGHLKVAGMARAANFSVDWQLDSENWIRGGVTDVRFNQRWFFFREHHEIDLALLPDLFNLESLGLAEFPVTEAGLAPLRQLIHLKELNLSRMNQFGDGQALSGLSDDCLVPVQWLAELRTLALSGNRITDRGLALLAGLTHLENLDLDATEITDAGLVQLYKIKTLKTVNLAGTQVTPEGIKRLQSAIPGLEINLEMNPAIERVVKDRRGRNP